MNFEYYKVTSELDALEVLRYLNDLGIHNISGEVLKYFITDLKKLIKYDLENRNEKVNVHDYEVQWSERLHSASTFSSRVRSRTQETPEICTKECVKSRKPFILRNTQSAPNIGVSKHDDVKKPERKACSCIIEKKNEVKVKEKNVCSSNNLIKVPRRLPQKKCDPVSLYHYYTSLWSKFKPNVPGENDWAELRWQVRQKMAGSDPKQTVTKINLFRSIKLIVNPIVLGKGSAKEACSNRTNR
ncbi:hypothetical protein K1T71_008859 [Dendrolimus kikuchii]|uniref:Uncharacterized protein n=1 Tax=Dendrolimus kikuchii TaxID=765133 RepID=A0ACC1CW42_9NEOP|nr:hypothetical protein K1T71_008859 [Dendrolimus kikuchii]